MLYVAARKTRDGGRVDFVVHVQRDDADASGQLVPLYAVCGPGDEGEPVLTVMLPHED